MKQYFEGWYFKHQLGDNTLCLIPGRAEDSAFILLITNTMSCNLEYPLQDFQKLKQDEIVRIGPNHFSKNGISLDIKKENLELKGTLSYQDIVPIPYDIMGPFALLPMQTKHTVLSMNHILHGTLFFNGTPLCFDNGKGYIEGDRGRSFPQSYAWVHCNDFQTPCSIMLSIAQIPIGNSFFWGCIGIVWYHETQYRFATYKGVRIIKRQKDHLEVSQGKYRLIIKPNASAGHKLAAPDRGKMVRSIHENASCPAQFIFQQGDNTIFDLHSSNASFEFVDSLV